MGFKLGYWYKIKGAKQNSEYRIWRKCVEIKDDNYSIKARLDDTDYFWVDIISVRFDESKYNPRNEKIRRILNDRKI